MLFAALAKVLLRKPPLVQAIVLGLCCGCFVAATAQANDRDPVLGRTVVLVLVWAAVTGGAFLVGLVAHRGRAAHTSTESSRPVGLVYLAVWLLGLAAALRALLGEGGFSVAVLAIVPLVLLAPLALHGLRDVVHPATRPS